MDLREKIQLLAALDQRAQEMGFDICLPVLAKDICLDDRVRMHCQLNLCGNYGKNLMCPPFLPPLAETRQLISSFTFAFLLQLKRDLDSNDKIHMRVVFDATALLLNQMLVSLERDAFNSGFRLAMALGAGECKICPTCIIQEGEEHCLNPGAARPSMEGMGIDVIKTFRAAGLPMDFIPDALTVAGLLLID